jgi:hypothetical protein
VGTADGLHRVELQEADPAHDPSEVPDVNPVTGCRVVESLCGECDPSSGRCADPNGTG